MDFKKCKVRILVTVMRQKLFFPSKFVLRDDILFPQNLL